MGLISDKLILVDCDGVLLDWGWMFHYWMQKHGYKVKTTDTYAIEDMYELPKDIATQLMNMFNETVYIRNLPPYRDAIHYTRKLHVEHGYQFHVITSIGSDYMVVDSRVANLHSVFGRSMFFDITCLDHSISKATVLSQYKDSGCYWIEDYAPNFELGMSLGLNSLLMDRSHNQLASADGRRVTNWAEIYNTIIG